MNCDNHQIFLILKWIVLLQIISAGAYPICFGLFSRLPDHGYALAKFLGIFLASYLCWVMAALTPLTGVFDFSVTTAWLAIGVLLIIGGAFLTLNAKLIFRQTWVNIKTILCIEIVFWGTFALMFALRSQIPQITHIINDSAAEKFTDFAILNSLLSSPAIPPQDAWVSGATMNYYYFGHFLWAFITKATGVLPEVAFNLALCSVAGLIAALTFALGMMVGGKLRWGWITAFLVVIGGNLDSTRLALIWLTQQSGIPFDFWAPSRAVANCITEFPAFSLILSDLHAHLLDCPTLLAAMLIGMEFIKTRGFYPSLRAMLTDRLSTLALMALLLGAASATNSWDMPVMLAFFALILWCGEIEYSTLDANAADDDKTTAMITGRLAGGLISLAVAVALAAIGVFILFAPFHMNFQAPFDGFPIRFNLPENVTEFSEFVSHWGIFLLPVFILLIRNAFRFFRKGNHTPTTIAFIFSATILVASMAFTITKVTGVLSIAIALGATALLLCTTMTSTGIMLTALLLLLATMTTFCEIFHIDDVFDDKLERINTIFKVYYALWPIAAITAIMALKQLKTPTKLIILIIMISAAALYTPIAVNARLAMTSRPPKSAIGTPLDGLSYLQKENNADLEAIRFIRDNIPPTHIILECTGTQYTYAGRMSTCTGRPTPGGWLTHEWEWRGEYNFGEERERRTSETLAIYIENDLELTESLLKKNQIRWVVIGKTEREKIPYLNKNKFGILGKLAFRADDTSIYLVFPNNRYPY